MNDLPPPIQHLGRYDILRVLGQGAMGVVYEGRDPNLDRRVAIKTVRVVGMAATEIAEYEQRFKTEARSAGRLQHPNIVSVYDSDTHMDGYGKTAYIVMEFVQGEDLKHFLDQGKRFSLEQTAFMVADLLSALDYAHKNKIIHRDIKPANLLLTKEGRIKLTDFGVARITDSGEATKTSGGTVGTLKYMSPEQVAGKGVDASSDLFSAGIVLYQLLTGVRPFDGEGYLDIVSKIVKEDPTPPSHIVGALPPSLDAVVAKALAKSKLDRFADAASFATALKAAVNNADLTITPSAHARPEVLEGIGTFPGSVGTGSSGSTVTQELELVYWKDIKESTEPDILEGFLKRFPVGIYADLAKRRLKSVNDAQLAAGSASRYEATQLRKPGEATMVHSPAMPVTPVTPTASITPVGTEITGAVLANTVTAAGAGISVQAAADDPTLPPSAYNDSEYGASTQFSPTQFPMTEPGALSKTSERSADRQAETVTEGAMKPMPLETAPAQLPPSARKAKSSTPWGLIGAIAVTISAAAFWFTRSPAPLPAPVAQDPVALTATSVISPGTPSSSVSTATSLASNETSSAAVPASATTTAATAATTTTSPMAAASTPAANASAPSATRSVAPLAAASAPARAASAARALQAARKASAATSTTPTFSGGNPVAAPSPEPAAVPASQRATSAAGASPPAAPAARAAAGPREACSDRLLFGFLTCMAEQCERSIYRSHPVCIERREMEERRRVPQ